MPHDAPQRRRGRPPGRSVGETIALRLPLDIEQRLAAWIAGQDGELSRSDAIRRLLHRALPKPPRPPQPPGLSERRRKSGAVAWYWVARSVTPRAKGFTPATVRLHGKTHEERAKRCEKLTAALREWIAGR